MANQSRRPRFASPALGWPSGSKKRAGSALSLQLTFAMLSTSLIAIVPLLFFAVWAMLEVDRGAAARERTLIERAIDDQMMAVAREQRSVTEWDDAVIKTAARDDVWMDENVGVWMHDFYKHDMAVVLDQFDECVYVMIGGERAPSERFEREKPKLARMIAALRADVLAAEEGIAELMTTDVMTIEGRPSLVTIHAITPSSDRLTQRPEDAYLHVAVRHIDGDFLSDLGARHLVADVRFEPAGVSRSEAVGLPLEGSGGPVGRVVWDQERPGLRLIAKAAPGVAASALILLGLSGSLLARLRRAVGRVHDSEAHAKHLALHDVLTGLPNRALFDARLEEALVEVESRGGRFAVHSIDLDRFKNVNDTLGHPAGDALIHEVAYRLSGLVRRGDTVARLGGDEFAVIQAGIQDGDDARAFADRVLEAVRRPFQLGADVAFVDSSIGTVMAPDYGRERAELMRKVDIALYEAKGAGKGRQCLFEAAQDEVVRRKRAIERDLRDDLGRGAGLRVVFQPVFAIDGTTLAGAEALVRWDHPEHGALSPALFVPVAEERGLIEELGAWVLREAVIAAKALELPWVAVNVSAVQFREARFVDLVLDLLAELRFSPERLQLEITEGLLLDATDTVAASLTKLRFAGVCIALDDFGTGYSSLKYLHRYKVDKIKIDQSFVRNLGIEEGTDAIVRAMVELARALGLGLTAEGVETEAQWRRLADFGAPELQGYLFSKPVDRGALRAVAADAARARRDGAA